MADTEAVEVWARREAKKALAMVGIDDPHPGTVTEYAGKLRTEVLLRGGDRAAAAASIRLRLGVGPWSSSS